MFFKPNMRAAIEEGCKTATRRIWKRPHVKVGGTYGVRKGGMYSKEIYFKIKVLYVYKQKLGDMTEEDAMAEGFKPRAGITALWFFMNYWKSELKRDWNPSQEVYVISFEILRENQVR
jgi:hypothetical protein